MLFPIPEDNACVANYSLESIDLGCEGDTQYFLLTNKLSLSLLLALTPDIRYLAGLLSGI